MLCDPTSLLFYICLHLLHLTIFSIYHGDQLPGKSIMKPKDGQFSALVRGLHGSGSTHESDQPNPDFMG